MGSALRNPVLPRKRPRVLAIVPQFIPSTILTVIKPLTALHQARQIDADITLEDRASLHQIQQADVIVFSRNTEPLYGRLLESALAFGKPVIYDIDDNFFELPAYYQSELPHRTPERLAQLTRYVRNAALVRVYSDVMRNYIKQFNPRVARVDGAVDWRLTPRTPLRDAERVRIVYATSRIHKDDLAEIFLDDMRRILAAYRGRVEFYCWGYHPPELRGRPGVHFLEFMRNYDRFFQKFARARFAIGLAPLRNEPFYRAKSDNKFREYAACRIAGVYSDIDVYSACVVHEQTGLLVSNTPGAWFDAVARLIEDRALRERIRTQALAYARERYSLEKVQRLWIEQISQLSAQGSAFFSPPQKGLVGCDGSDRELMAPSSPSSSIDFGVREEGLVRFIRRGKRLADDVRRRGIRVAVKERFWRIHNLCGLLRTKWGLLRTPRL